MARSRIKVSYYPPGFDVPTLCCHCHDPRCLPACPSKAISKRRNIIVIDEVLCDGCGKCVSACPYDGVFVDAERMKVINCTLCGQCVKECPTGCLTFQEGKEVNINQNERANKIRNRSFERFDSSVSGEEVGS